jgi:hypothetical protein
LIPLHPRHLSFLYLSSGCFLVANNLSQRATLSQTPFTSVYLTSSLSTCSNIQEEIPRISTLQKVSVILSNTNDWDEWIEVVKVYALAREVWEYVDPSKVEVPVLKEPTLPRPEDVNADIISYRRLLAEEKDDYKMLRQNYKLEINRYTRKKSALSSLSNHIQSSVSRSCLFYIYGTTTAREMLVELKKRL